MSLDVAVRRAREDDAAAIAALLNPIIAAGGMTVMDEPATDEGVREFLQSLFPVGLMVVAVRGGSGGAIVGVQEVIPSPVRAFRHVGDVGTFVALDSLRQGVGARLCEVAFPAARVRGLTKLWATIRADNPRALAFYEAQGFRVVGTAQRHARVGDVYVDEVLAERLL